MIRSSVTTCCFIAAAFAGNVRAQTPPAPSAQDILSRVAAVYSHLSSIHIIAKRDEGIVVNGQSGSSGADWEIAAAGKQQHFARLKQEGEQAMTGSDGETTWKALSSRKQWSRVDAAALDSDEAEAGDAKPTDLYDLMAPAMFGMYASLAKSADGARIVRQEDFKLGRDKVRCYVIHARVGNSEDDFWVDEQRYLVLALRQKLQQRDRSIELQTKVTMVAVNQPLPDSLFQFAPGKGWSEVDALTLPGEDNLSLAGTRAADFTLKSLAGDPVALDQTRGKVVVLDFWATWCPPCRKEMPTVDKLRAQFGDAIQVYGISDEDAGTVRDFVRKNGYQIAMLLDGKKQVHREYRVRAIPTLLIIDKQGVIRNQFLGTRDETELRKAIQTVLAAN